MATMQSLERWYALAVITPRERKIKGQIEDKLRRAGLDNIEIICPEEDVVVDGGPGKDRQTVKRLTIPGYLLIRGRRLSPDQLLMIRRIGGVLGWMGGDESPTPLGPNELDRILGQRPQQRIAGRSAFSVDDEVVVIEGPLADFRGSIKEINEGKQEATVEVEIFGRTTPAQVPFASLRKT